MYDIYDEWKQVLSSFKQDAEAPDQSILWTEHSGQFCELDQMIHWEDQLKRMIHSWSHMGLERD